MGVKDTPLPVDQLRSVVSLCEKRKANITQYAKSRLEPLWEDSIGEATERLEWLNGACWRLAAVRTINPADLPGAGGARRGNLQPDIGTNSAPTTFNYSAQHRPGSLACRSAGRRNARDNAGRDGSVTGESTGR
ncbi:hypothetical protein Bbelb_182790 [Branchiostoma belcheri]|nr:hypothetical protein Bbelb_182790 [Branchiostoma belcheri]